MISMNYYRGFILCHFFVEPVQTQNPKVKPFEL